MKRQYRLLHKWLGIFSFVFILVVSITALGLNHHDLLISKKSVENSINISSLKAFSVDPFNSNTIVASDLKGIYKSEDNGLKWSELKLYVPSDNISFISFSPLKKDTFAVAKKDKGVYLSDDAGEVWEQLQLTFTPEAENIEGLNFSTNKLIIKTALGIYTYDLNKETWQTTKLVNLDKSQYYSIKEFIYDLHTGRIFGQYGVYLYDLLALSLILLSLSGLFLTFKMRTIKQNAIKIRTAELKQEAILK